MDGKKAAILHIAIALVFALAIIVSSALIDDPERSLTIMYILLALYMVPFGILSAISVKSK